MSDTYNDRERDHDDSTVELEISSRASSNERHDNVEASKSKSAKSSRKGDKDDDDLKGTDGDDVLTGNDKNNKIEGKDGNDTLSGMDGNDHLDGDAGDDWLDGGDGNDQLDGGEGNDTLIGGAGNDKLEGKSGNDVLQGGDGNDNLKGDDGDDQLSGGAGNDKLDGGAGNDQLDGGKGKDNIKGGDGDDRIIWRAGDGEDNIDGGDGRDTFVVTTSNIVHQNILVDVNSKGHLVVTLDGGDEGAELELENIENLKFNYGVAGATVQFTDAARAFLGDAPVEIDGGEGDDVIDASTSTQPVNISAGAGNDTVTGGSGSDVISGGAGDDVINAGVGNDKVLWRAGDGNDVIDGGEGFDELDLTMSESQASSLSISADANGNVILISDDGTRLTVKGVEDIVINAGTAGTSLVIGDLTGTDIAQDTLYFVGGAGNDSLDASATDRRINATGNGGNDTLRSGSGNDTLNGGDGNDTLDAGSGSGVDTILGGAGDDTIFATLGDEQDSNAIDIVDGGSGTDQLNVLFVEPTPHDLILRVQSNGDGTFSIRSEDININETVRVSNVENLRISAGEGALNFVVDSLADTSLVQNGVDFDGSSDADYFNGNNTDVHLNLQGNGGNDTLIGGSQSDNLRGGDGNDSLSGGEGDDFLAGGAGDDILDGGQGFDTADYTAAAAGVTVNLNLFAPQDTGAAGTDTLVNIERVVGSAFADTLTANNLGSNLDGGAGNDQLHGGDGFDFLRGGAGDDTLVDAGSGLLSGDAGNDHIDGTAHYENDSSGVYVNLSNQSVDVHGNGTLVLAARTAVDGYGDTDTFGSNAINLHASNFADHVTGSDDNQYFFLRAGDDVAFGLGGNDTFYAGSGNDIIDGGDGFDGLNYQDDGNDGNGPATQGINANLATGIIIDGFGNTDTVSNIEAIVGSELNDTLIGDDNNNNLFARGGDDTIHGGGGNDLLAGWSGNDIIHGDDGNDTLIGDADDDTLSGGAGADTYIFNTFSVPNAAFGHDTITDFDVAEDRLNLSLFDITSLADVQAIATDDGSHTTITIDSERSILLQNVTVAQLVSANFIFADAPGPGITGTENNDVLTGTSGDDFIYGLEGNDMLEGLAGNDTLDGGDGFDRAVYRNEGAGVTVNLALGTATDGSGDTDTLISIENVEGSNFSDILLGDAGNNLIFGDSTAGGAGSADVISGGAGDDTIIPGGGIDSVDGGDGIDVIYFTRDGINFGEVGLTITFQPDGSITSYNPNTGETETNILNVEAVIGTVGTDTITGNAQDNYIESFYGSSTLDGGAGNDTVMFTIGAAVTVDLANGLAFRPGLAHFGTDTLLNFENVIGGSNGDVLIGDAQNNILEGLRGDDLLRGGAGDDRLNGGASERLWAFSGGEPEFDGNDTADYSTDPAAVTVNLASGTATDGWGDTDTLISIESAIGSAFNDTLIGDAGANELNGGGGDDSLTLGAGPDSVLLDDDGFNNAAFGHDTVTDFDTNEDQINLRAFSNLNSINQLSIAQDGADTVIEFDANNSIRLSNVTAANLTEANFEFAQPLNLVGTPGNDELHGDAGNDSISGLGGDDRLFGHDGDDYIDGGDGSDQLWGGNGNDNLNGGNDNSYDRFWGEAGNDVINTGTGGSFASGGDGDDTITGGLGNWDHLEGNAGNDTLILPDNNGFVDGGPGNDILDGFLFYENDPAGVVVNLDSNDWDVFGDGSQIVAARTAADGYGDIDTLQAGARNMHGSFFNDFVKGDAFSHWMNLRAGDDTVYGMGGDDNTRGGSGNDFIDGGDGFDRADYEADEWDGGPPLTGLGVVVNLSSSAFDYGTGIAPANSATDNWGDTDTLFNIEAIRGSVLDDVLIGSDVHNWIEGNDGDDKIYGGDDFGDNLLGGPGNDLIDGQGGDNDTAWYNHWQVTNGIHVDLSAGIAYDDGHGDTDTLVSIESVQGSAFNDLIIGDAKRNSLNGNDGDDIIYGGDGDDIIDGRNGDDELFGEGGNDRFHGSFGTDLIDGGAGSDQVTFESFLGSTSGVSFDMNNIVDAGGYTNVVVASDGFGGVDYLRSIERVQLTDYDDTVIGDGNDNDLQGNAGNDVLIGGAGNDNLRGGDDFDTLDGGAGIDFLNGGENDDTLTGGTEHDVFQFTRFTNQGNLTSFGQDIITDFGVFEDRLDLYNVPEFSSLEALQSYAVQDGNDVLISFQSYDFGVPETNSIRLQNLTLADLPNMNINFSPIQGTEGDDVLNSSEFGETLIGRGGNDVLNGNGGNDNLIGGPGNDTLDGGDGNDFIRSRWNGETTGVVIDLSTGIVANDGFGFSDTVVNVENVEGTQFGDTITGDALNNFIDGREGNDLLHGGDGHDRLDGREGDDALFGDDGDDDLIGGTGSDLLDGGNGMDRVQYGSWTGTTSGITIDLSNVLAAAGGHSNVVEVISHGADATDYLRNVESVFATDFADNLTGDESDNQLFGQGGDDVISGNGGNDSLNGGDGNDVLDGGAGNDFFSSSRGNDTIDGGADWDTLGYRQFTGVTNGVHVDLGANTVFNDGFGFTDTVFNIERVDGSEFNDVLIGSAINNHILGHEGDDTLTNGAGHDTLEGGIGNDTFLLSEGGNVHIPDFVAGAGTEDVINLQNISALTDFNDVFNAASDDGSGNTNIDLGGFNLHLTGISKASLHVDDFIF